MPRKLLPSYVNRKLLKKEQEVGRDLEVDEERDIRKRFDRAELMMRKGFEQNKSYSEITGDAQNNWNLYTAYMESLDVHPDDVPATPVRDELDEKMEAIAENIGQAVIQPPQPKVLATPERGRPLMGVDTTLGAMRDIYEFSPIAMRQLEIEDAPHTPRTPHTQGTPRTPHTVSPQQRTDTEAKSEEEEEEEESEEEEEESEEEEEESEEEAAPPRRRSKRGLTRVDYRV